MVTFLVRAWTEVVVLFLALVGVQGYTIEEVQAHSSQADCWVVFEGKVFTFPGGGTRHPRGDFYNYWKVCGKDGTEAYRMYHPTSMLNRPSRAGGSLLGPLTAPAPAPTPAPTPAPAPAPTTRAPTTRAPTIAPSTARTTARTTASTTTSAAAAVVKYSIEDVQAHSSAATCWVVFHGNVYSFPGGAPSHPSCDFYWGYGICGRDGTAQFDTRHPLRYLTSQLSRIGGSLLSPLAASAAPSPATFAPATTVRSTATTTSTAPALVAYSIEDVQAHNSIMDCWVVFHGNVYSFPGGATSHPRGDFYWSLRICGTEATAQFDAQHPLRYLTSQLSVTGGYLLSPLAASASPASETTAPASTTAAAGPAARPCRSDEPAPNSSRVTLAQLQAHSTKEDCWMVIGCGVYSLQRYEHSGGDVVYSWCGTDGTDGFTGQHPWSFLDLLLTVGASLVGGFEDRQASVALSAVSPGDVAVHNSEASCWTSVGGVVYDLTFYFGSHPGGDAVLQPMCGEEATAYFRMAHGDDVLHVLPKRGLSVDDWDIVVIHEVIYDVVAFGGYVILPIIGAFIGLRLPDVRWQDRLLRRPVSEPLKVQVLGPLLNSYLEMPLGVAMLLLWFFFVTGVLLLTWLLHYNEFYPAANGYAGAIGRMTVYLISLANALGTRRWSLSWSLWRISYEKSLKLHYFVGNAASTFMLAHAGTYLSRWGPLGLPRQVLVTSWGLLFSIVVLFPMAAITNIRVCWYGLFRVTHFLAPVIMFLSVAHIVCLRVDKKVGPNFALPLLWLAWSTALWLGDFLHRCYDLRCRTVKVVEGPSVLQADGDTAFVTVILQKNIRVPPGSWMQVSSPEVSALHGHPFTAIVRRREGPAELEFLWKVNPGLTWTQSFHDLVVQRNQAATAGSKLPEWNFHLAGPYGGGLGSLSSLKVVIFLVAGVGVTPAASMVPFLIQQGKEVHVVWACRSLTLIRHVAGRYFEGLRAPPPQQVIGKVRRSRTSPIIPGYFEERPGRLHIHLTGASTNAQGRSAAPPYVVSGRPNIHKVIEDVALEAATRRLRDVGVFVCGPAALVSDALSAADAVKAQVPGSHVHVHSESFQM